MSFRKHNYQRKSGDSNEKAFDLKAIFSSCALTLGSCWKTILLFSAPIIVSYLLQQVYSISDAAIVGQTLTADEVAGVTDTTPLVFVFLQFAFGSSAGFLRRDLPAASVRMTIRACAAHLRRSLCSPPC